MALRECPLLFMLAVILLQLPDPTVAQSAIQTAPTLIGYGVDADCLSPVTASEKTEVHDAKHKF